MPTVKLIKEDLEFLNNNYPKLHHDHVKNVIVGTLSFDLKYKDKEQLSDSYRIEIDLNQVSELGMPLVKEIDGRILEIAKAKDTFYGNLHLNNEDGEMCMILPPKVKEKYPNGFDLKILLEHMEEHLYWISYYEKYDEKPWEEYGHGELGYYQLYLEDNQKYKQAFKDRFNCKTRPEFRREIKRLRKKYKL